MDRGQDGQGRKNIRHTAEWIGAKKTLFLQVCCQAVGRVARTKESGKKAPEEKGPAKKLSAVARTLDKRRQFVSNIQHVLFSVVGNGNIQSLEGKIYRKSFFRQ